MLLGARKDEGKIGKECFEEIVAIGSIRAQLRRFNATQSSHDCTHMIVSVVSQRSVGLGADQLKLLKFGFEYEKESMCDLFYAFYHDEHRYR